MSIFYKGDIYGCNILGSPSVRGHLRPIDNDFGVVNVFRTCLLDDGLAGMEQNSGITNICSVQLPSIKHEGKEGSK